MNEDLIRLAKRWYTEQRGRVVGNTRAWDDLSQHEKFNIICAVEDAVETMEEAWLWTMAARRRPQQPSLPARSSSKRRS